MPKPGAFSAVDNSLIDNLTNSYPDLQKNMEQRDLNTYLKKVISFSFDANKYFNDSEPWAVRKVDVQRMNTILFTIIEQIKNISLLLNPIIPIASNKILDKLNIENEDILFKNIFNKKLLNTNLKLKKTEILFKKVEDDN